MLESDLIALTNSKTTVIYSSAHKYMLNN